MYLSITRNTFKVFLTIGNTFYICSMEKDITRKKKNLLYEWKLFEIYLEKSFLIHLTFLNNNFNNLLEI